MTNEKMIQLAILEGADIKAGALATEDDNWYFSPCFKDWGMIQAFEFEADLGDVLFGKEFPTDEIIIETLTKAL